MREFDQAPGIVREGWNARRVSRALRGSWSLAKGIAFEGTQLPVGNQRRWERQQETRIRRRGTMLAFSAVQDWLQTGPTNKSVRAYLGWREQCNREVGSEQFSYPSYPTICQFWSGSWSQLVAAVEAGRSPEGSPAEDLGDGDADAEARVRAAVEELEALELGGPRRFRFSDGSSSTATSSGAAGSRLEGGRP